MGGFYRLRIYGGILSLTSPYRHSAGAGISSITPFVYGSRNIWLKDTAPLVPPGTALGKAVHYARNHYTRVIRYLKYPEVTPDNNIAENAIRISGVPQGEARGTLAAPFVIGRKNWLFCSIPRWAYASAVMYSLTETAKANDLNPQT